MTVAGAKAQRNPALDFTKGALVLFMVLYHWLEYFVSTTGDFYRYIRFVTPSFIFITGFLISNIYLSKYEISDPRLPRRLLQRGLKLLAFLAFGVLGVLCGYVPIEKINRFLSHAYMIVGAYVGYLIAIRIWDVTYPLLVVGVCLSVMLIYLVGAKASELGGVRKHVELL